MTNIFMSLIIVMTIIITIVMICIIYNNKKQKIVSPIGFDVVNELT